MSLVQLEDQRECQPLVQDATQGKCREGVKAERLGDLPPAENLDKYYGLLVAFVNARFPRRLRRFIGASDIVQSVLILLGNRRAQFRGSSENQFRAWMYQIARHKILDGIRRYRVRNAGAAALRSGYPTLGDVDTGLPEDPLSDFEVSDQVLMAINSLPDELRETIILRYSEGLTFQEIGERLNCPMTTCRRRWLEACGLLQEKLGSLL